MNRHSLAEASDPPGAIVQASFQPTQPVALQCTWRTGSMGPAARPVVGADLFVSKPQLNNGWRFPKRLTACTRRLAAADTMLAFGRLPPGVGPLSPFH